MILQETIDDIILMTLELGQLSKEYVLEAWDINEEQYEELQAGVLKHDRLEKGPRGTGGFAVRQTRERLPDETETQGALLQASWEQIALPRLVELLQHRELEELLGPLKDALRQSRKAKTSVDRRGTKTELAAALITQHDIDLFAHSPTRKLVGKKCRVKSPQRWYPGKKAALDFVRDTQFPEQLAGLPTPDRLPDYEYLEGHFILRPLQDFQKEVSKELFNILSIGRGIVTLPTGAGKTRVAVETIRDHLSSICKDLSESGTGRAVLWLAHTEELCEQAYECFKQVWVASVGVCPLLLVRFWGRYTQNLADHKEERQWILKQPSIVISTPQRIVGLLDNDMTRAEEIVRDLQRTIGILVIDEAHRAAAPSYGRILADLLPKERLVSIIGLTATPFREEYLANDPDKGTKELKSIFENLIEPVKTLGENPRMELVNRGVLARPVFESIPTPTSMKVLPLLVSPEISDADIARIDWAMALRADNSARRLAILNKLLPLTKNCSNSILYFGPSVRDAECMAFLLRQENVLAAVLSGETREVTRRRLIEKFRGGTLQVLCNCEVLTTGFDAPRVTHIVMARPTVSRVLYEQIIGRGLRGPLFGGTETCVILDCEDNFRDERPPLGYESFRSIWDKQSYL